MNMSKYYFLNAKYSRLKSLQECWTKFLALQ
jgi:hypothetical protein